MERKTEYAGCFNEDDFTQRGGALEELTVTITLCEYRNIVRDLARSELQIERMQDEKAELEKKCADFANALAACKLPEWVKNIGRALSGKDAADEETERGVEREFKRLTARVGGVAGLAPEYEELFTTNELIDLLLNNLAAYEDTGLTPEEIEELKGGV